MAHYLLTREKRYLIPAACAMRCRTCKIARELNRSASTISREL